jgi:hypothetical protein
LDTGWDFVIETYTFGVLCRVFVVLFDGSAVSSKGEVVESGE